MSTIFWFALVAGAGLLALPLLGDVFDVGAADGHGHAGAHEAADGMKILSLRNASYFLFGFGAVGVLLSWFWHGAYLLLTAAAAGATGLGAAAISALIFGYVRRTHSGDIPGDSTLRGLVGTVTLPISAGGTGKIVVARSGREYEILARPFDPESIDAERWSSVVVVEIDNGIALVAPYTEQAGL